MTAGKIGYVPPPFGPPGLSVPEFNVRRFRILLAVWLLAPIPAASAGDWPVFRGNPAMSGVAEAKLPDELHDRWSFKTRGEITSAPAVKDGVVYVASLDKFLYALELATGKEKWKVQLGAMKAAPAIANGRVFVGDLDGKFYAVDAKTGEKIWTFQIEGEITGGANFHKDNVLIGAHDSTLYCLSAAKGEKVWDFKIDGPVNGAVAVVGDRTFVAGCDSILHVLDANTGKSVGQVDLGGQAGATAAVAGDSVYVGTMSNQVVEVNWKKPAKGWTFEPKRRQQPFYASAAVTESLVITGSRDRKVYALDRKTGKEKWSFVTEGMVDSSPVVVGNRVYVGCLSSGAEFYVLDLASGRKVQELTMDSAVCGSAAVAGDCLLVGTEKGTLYCLGAKK